MTIATTRSTITEHEAAQVERANAAYKKQKRNKGVTEIVKMPGRGHSLTIDAGWREVAEKALEFVKRFTTITERAA